LMVQSVVIFQDVSRWLGSGNFWLAAAVVL
jgi:hypothetical protein